MKRGTLFKKLLDVYGFICGKTPNLRLSHFDYSATAELFRVLRPILAQLKGSVLDVGCGNSSYRNLMNNVEYYVGLETDPDSGAEIIIKPSESWPVADESFDNVIILQVLEHVNDLQAVLSEIKRVLKPQGTLIISIPFLYNEHGSPDDYRRLTTRGLTSLLEDDYKIIEVSKIGGIGTTLTILILNFFVKYKPTRILILFVFPMWLVACTALNLFAKLLDRLDDTQMFYNNIVLKAYKK